MLRAPAEVDALAAALDSVAPDDRTLGPGTRVKGEPDTVVEVALLHDDIVRNAPNDAIAVEIAHCHATDGNSIAVIEADAAIVERALVDHNVMGLVAVDGDVLDGDISDAGALKQREIRGDLGVADDVETLLEAPIEFVATA